MLGWQAEWMAYEIELDERLSTPALVVPVFEKAVVGSTATVQVPAQSVLQQYAGMEFGTYYSLHSLFNAPRRLYIHCVVVVIFVLRHCQYRFHEACRQFVYQRTDRRFFVWDRLFARMFDRHGSGLLCLGSADSSHSSVCGKCAI